MDYAAIYKYIDDLLRGELPKQPNEATCAKIYELFHELRESVVSSESATRDERVMLERFTFRDLGNLNAQFVNKCTDSQVQILSTLPKINPLCIAPSFFTKPFLPKESKGLPEVPDLQ